MFILRWFWSILKGVLNTLARAAVILVLLFIVLAVVGSASDQDLPDKMVLALDLRETLEDKTTPDFFDFETRKMSLIDVVLGLDAASRDARVSGVFLRIGSGDLSVPKSEELRESLKLQMLLVTRGDKGMTLFREGSAASDLPAKATEVFDVSGAGDTVVASFALALATGMNDMDSLHFANTAAGVVVRKIGTATVSLDEINMALKTWKGT